MMALDRIETEFQTVYSKPPENVIRAPGRVNLIGEHTDYNDGFVLPMAIDRDLLIASRARTDDRVHFVALDYGRQSDEFSVEDITPLSSPRWVNYIRGVAYFLRQQGFEFPGVDAVITSTIPAGAGLSSSAALEVCTGVTLTSFAPNAPDLVRLALVGQKAENEFVGLKSGIMDQFTSALAQEGKALLIDCRDLSHRNVSIPPGVAIVVADTMKKHQLTSSGYNTRRAECEAAAAQLASLLGKPVKSLRDVSLAEFRQVEAKLPPVLAKRARHVITENARVLQAVEALLRRDVAEFGRLMDESHRSMRDDFEISIEEVDIMVESARSHPACFGARLTGGGFGGSTVNLVREDEVGPFVRYLQDAYRERTGIQSNIMHVRASAGVGPAKRREPTSQLQ